MCVTFDMATIDRPMGRPEAEVEEQEQEEEREEEEEEEEEADELSICGQQHDVQKGRMGTRMTKIYRIRRIEKN
ncbi:hypothetical protein M0802_003850 [Mischocyttarus mexicanus]|nr:hypothetical protein M0802_003850 [Mischocyttarus mexicanus]